MRKWCIFCRFVHGAGECEHFSTAPAAALSTPKPIDLTRRIRSYTNCVCACHAKALLSFGVVACARCCKGYERVAEVDRFQFSSNAINDAVEMVNATGHHVLRRFFDEPDWVAGHCWGAKVGEAEAIRLVRRTPDTRFDDSIGKLIKNVGFLDATFKETRHDDDGNVEVGVYDVDGVGQVPMDMRLRGLLDGLTVKFSDQGQMHSIFVGLRGDEVLAGVSPRRYW
jgi:hypothetical protein